MLISQFHKTLRDDEAGQALVVGALTMLVLAFAVFSTIQLGHTINERIRVQNAADNSAFSTAAVVARSLNFIAWVNRSIASQYVAAMAVQSIVAIADGLEALVGITSDMLQSLSSIACGLARAAEVCCASVIGSAVCCPLVPILEDLSRVLQTAAKALRTVADEGLHNLAAAIDTPVALFVKFVVLLNRFGMYGAQKAMKLMTEGILLAPAANNFQRKIMTDVADKTNDSDVGTAYNLLMGAYNSGVGNAALSAVPASYQQLFDTDGSESIPLGGTCKSSDNSSCDTYSDDSKVQRAERMMAEVTNASRLGESDLTWETDNGFDPHKGGFMGAAASVMQWLGFDFMGASRLVRPMTPERFTEDSGTGALPSGITDMQNNSAKASSPECAAAKSRANSAKADYQAKQGKCDSDNSACSANPSSSGCSSRGSDCAAAADAQSAADDATSSVGDSCGSDNSDALKQLAANPGGLDTSSPNYVFTTGKDTTQFTRGGALASPEYVKASFLGLSYLSGGGSPKIVGPQAAYSDNERMHCRYDKRKLITVPSCPDYAWTKPAKCEKESKHEFDGITKYLSYNIINDDKQLFGQRDYISLVNKSPEAARFPIKELGWGGGTQKIGWAGAKGEGNKGSFSAGDPDFGIKGLNGWARSMAYYHRPKAWSEPPNLFNPFWKAKLAPMSNCAALTQFPGISALNSLGVIDEVLLH
jgi:hypothetical protein